MQEKDAGVKEWMTWMAQPLKTILTHHKDLVYGPVDDLMDDVFRKIAPKIVKSVVSQEIEEDVEEFIDGAREGRFESLDGQLADPLRGQSEDYEAGYQWGFSNAQIWDGKRLPASVESDVVRTQIKEFRGRVTEEVFIKLMEKSWHALSPRHTLKAMVTAVKQHGWKIGVGFAIFEIIEHTLLPAVMIKLTGDPEWALIGTLPIGEIVYAVVLKLLGVADKNLDELTDQGHLDWYEEKYGPVRLASQRRASCERVALRYITGASHV